MPETGGHRGRPSPARRLAGAASPRRRRPDAAPSRARHDDGAHSAGRDANREHGSTARPARGRGAATTRRRLWASLVHPGRGQVIAAMILFVVGIGGVMQLRINSADDAYTNARREDLVQILDGLGAESRRLESEIGQLERTRGELQSGADGRRVAREETRRRLDELAVLAGTAPAEGPGIRMRITDPQQKAGTDVLLDAVEEMRDAGAEVIEINDSVRVVASSWFAVESGRLVVDGRIVDRPLTLEVIGDPHSLEEAAQFRGGLVSEVTGPRIGGQVDIERLERITVDSLHPAQQNQYAQPASPAPTPR